MVIAGVMLNASRCTSGTGSYVALGDSLAAGIGAAGMRGYVFYYYHWLLQCKRFKGISCCNLGVPGWTSADLLAALCRNMRYRYELERAVIITVDIGGNDIKRSQYSEEQLYSNLIAFESNLKAIIYNIRLVNKQAALYMMDIYNPYPEWHEKYAIAERWVKRYNAALRNICCGAYGKVNGVAGVYQAFKGNETQYTLIKYGNIHPNTCGHQAMSMCLEQITEKNSCLD